MRTEYETIIDWIPEGSSVIDLGCGCGTLLKLLEEKKQIKGFGMDKSWEYVEICKGKGVDALCGRVDEYTHWGDKEFEFAICNVTLQMVEHPEVLLKEMFRISKNQIISFPNFAKWQNRLELLFKGRMPQWMLCGYKWYNTGHLHQLSIKDFELYIKDRGIVKKKVRILPNLLTNTAIYWIK